MNILLTSPHTYCYDNENRVCDRRAKSVLNILYQQLTVNKKFNIDTHINDKIRRIDCDLNRTICANTDYLLEYVHKLMNINFVIDVHSFPYTSFDNSYVALLYPTNNKNMQELCNTIKVNINKISNNNNFCKVFNGGANYIINTATKHNVCAFLLEIVEDEILLNNEQLTKICTCIGAVLDNYVYSNYPNCKYKLIN